MSYMAESANNQLLSAVTEGHNFRTNINRNNLKISRPSTSYPSIKKLRGSPKKSKKSEESTIRRKPKRKFQYSSSEEDELVDHDEEEEYIYSDEEEEEEEGDDSTEEEEKDLINKININCLKNTRISNKNKRCVSKEIIEDPIASRTRSRTAPHVVHTEYLNILSEGASTHFKKSNTSIKNVKFDDNTKTQKYSSILSKSTLKSSITGIERKENKIKKDKYKTNSSSTSSNSSATISSVYNTRNKFPNNFPSTSGLNNIKLDKVNRIDS